MSQSTYRIGCELMGESAAERCTDESAAVKSVVVNRNLSGSVLSLLIFACVSGFLVPHICRKSHCRISVAQLSRKYVSKSSG